MASPSKVVLLIVIITLLFSSNRTQQLPEMTGNTLLMMNIIDTLDNLSLQLKEQGKNSDTKMEALQEALSEQIRNSEEKMEALLEAHVKLEAKLEEQQQLGNSLEQCLTKDQFHEFHDLLATDDCEDGRHNCSDSATCTDSFNEYKCACNPGYSGDGFTCEDVDECSENIDTCSVDEICINSPGSFQCNKCPKYSKKVGDICQVPVCESPSLWIPSLGCLKVVLQDMNWEAAKSKCQFLGMRLAEGIRREHIEALTQHFNPITNNWSWVGLRNGRWLSTSGEEEVSEEDWREGDPGRGGQVCGCVDLFPSSLGLADEVCSNASHYALCQSLP